MELKQDEINEMRMLAKDFNRTNMELKRFVSLSRCLHTGNFNRTNMELKH